MTPFANVAPATETAPNETSRLAYTGAFGTTPGLGQPSNVVGDMYVATRTKNGWESKYIGLSSSEAFADGRSSGERLQRTLWPGHLADGWSETRA